MSIDAPRDEVNEHDGRASHQYAVAELLVYLNLCLTQAEAYAAGKLTEPNALQIVGTSHRYIIRLAWETHFGPVPTLPAALTRAAPAARPLLDGEVARCEGEQRADAEEVQHWLQEMGNFRGAVVLALTRPTKDIGQRVREVLTRATCPLSYDHAEPRSILERLPAAEAARLREQQAQGTATPKSPADPRKEKAPNATPFSVSLNANARTANRGEGREVDFRGNAIPWAILPWHERCSLMRVEIASESACV